MTTTDEKLLGALINALGEQTFGAAMAKARRLMRVVQRADICMCGHPKSVHNYNPRTGFWDGTECDTHGCCCTQHRKV